MGKLRTSPAPMDTKSTSAISLVNTQQDRKSKAVACGRLLFIGCLFAAAAALGVITHHFITASETELTETQFESIADRALAQAVGIARRKRLATVTMSSLVSEMHPDASSWPFVFVKNYERIANNLLKATSGENMGFGPFVTPEDLSEWERFAYDYYYNVRDPPFPSTGPNDNGTGTGLGTAVNSFGTGVWGVDSTLNTTDNRYHDTGASTNYGSPNNILMPVFQVDNGADQVLLLNVHFEETRGRAIDGSIDCSAARGAATGQVEDHMCGVITGFVTLVKFEHRGPGSIIYQPIYPANNKSTAVGLISTPIGWDEVLENIFADEVSGVDCVLHLHQVEGVQAFTYTVKDGVARPRGEGDLHQTMYQTSRRCRALTGDELYTDMSPIYELCLYPTNELYEVYATDNPRVATIGAVAIILFTSLLFFLYDFFVRQESNAKVELLESKRRFMRFVSHEVRTPLNSVCLGLELIQTEIAVSLGYKSAEALVLGAHEAAQLAATPGHETDDKSLEWFSLAHDIRTNAQSAVDVLNDLLNYDKIENGELQLELTLIRVWHLLERTVNEFKLPATNRKLHLELNFTDLVEKDAEQSSAPEYRAETLPEEVQNRKVVGDSVRLAQVFRNLLSNALKFTPEQGSVRVWVSWIKAGIEEVHNEASSKSFELKNGEKVSLQQSGQLQVSVEDSGAGMSKDQLSKLFRDGVQFNANDLQAGEGSGIGLYITKGIVEQHEGTLVAVSDGLGKGTTFTMTMPLYYALDAAETTRTDVTSENIGTTTWKSGDESTVLRILVVDDVLSNRKLLGRLLKNRGHFSAEAENGEIAVHMIAKAISDGDPYDTILMDYEMPVMNGPTATKEIRSMGCDVFVVGITGNVLPNDVLYFQSCGANHILTKPVQISDLEDLWVEHNVMAGCAAE